MLFKFPNFKKPLKLSVLTHLPIRILKISQIEGCLEPFPESLTNFIIDTRNFNLNPKIIEKNSNVNFIIALHYLRETHYHHLSNYLMENVKLYTTAQCTATISILQTFQNFTFKALSVSHIETFAYNNEDIFDFIISLKIERLSLDYLNKKISPKRIIGLNNIVHISSNIFDLYKEFPINLCKSIPSLESVHFRFNTLVHFDDFLSLQKTAISNGSTIFKDIKFHSLKFYSHLREGVVQVRHELHLQLKKVPEKWIQSLEERKTFQNLLLRDDFIPLVVRRNRFLYSTTFSL